MMDVCVRSGYTIAYPANIMICQKVFIVQINNIPSPLNNHVTWDYTLSCRQKFSALRFPRHCLAALTRQGKWLLLQLWSSTTHSVQNIGQHLCIFPLWTFRFHFKGTKNVQGHGVHTGTILLQRNLSYSWDTGSDLSVITLKKSTYLKNEHRSDFAEHSWTIIRLSQQCMMALSSCADSAE